MRILLPLTLVLSLIPWPAVADQGGRWARDDRYYPDAYLLASSGKRWEDLSPREREQIRRRKEQYESLPQSEQRRIRDARERYEKMPPQRQQQVRERWERLSDEEKRRYRLEKKQR